MKKLKVQLDREPIESKQIESKRNFQQVLTGMKQLKPPIWKNPWFYGPVGIASFALLLTVGIVKSQTTTADEEKTTLAAKNNLPDDTECIHAPIKGLEPQFLSFKVDADEEKTISLPSGTTLVLPKGSLINIHPDQKVELKIREFTSKSDAFLAGIPMDYHNDKAFESAGMIEIRAFQEGKEVQISPDKPIKVQMALTTNPDEFQFWKLDEAKKVWTNHPVEYQTAKVETLVSSNQLTVLDKQLSQTKQLIVANEEQLKENKLPTRIAVHLPLEGKQRFDLDFDVKEFPELEQFTGMEFEVAATKTYDKSFTKKTWSNVDLVKENESYYALFSNRQEKFKIAVRPVLSGIKKEKAEQLFEQSMLQYQQKKEKLEEEKMNLFQKKQAQQQKYDAMVRKLNKQQVAQRSVVEQVQQNELAASSVAGFKADFEVMNFGVYNCDKPINYPKPLSAEIAYSFSGNHPVHIESAYIFDEKKNTRFSFGAHTGHALTEVGCFENHPNVLLVLDREGNMGYCSDFNSSQINGGMVKLTRIEKKDVTLDFIQRLIDETPADS